MLSRARFRRALSGQHAMPQLVRSPSSAPECVLCRTMSLRRARLLRLSQQALGLGTGATSGMIQCNQKSDENEAERQSRSWKAHITRVPDRLLFAVPPLFKHADAFRVPDYGLCGRFHGRYSIRSQARSPENAPSFDSEVGGVCTDARPWFYSIGQYRVFLTHAGLKLCTFKYDHTDLRHALLVTDKKQKKSTESRMWTRTW